MYLRISIPLWYDYKIACIVSVQPPKSFQFLYGTIISEIMTISKAFAERFQFLYGTIISREIIEKVVIGGISIPLWYDYKSVQ